MTRWLMIAMAVIGLAVGATAAPAEEGHEHGGQPATQTITGEVVDLACYLGHGGAGAGHRECAQKCINSGLPVGIKSGDTLYLAIGREHGTANAVLGPLASKQVTVEGTVTERDGVHLIAVNKVTAS